MTAWNETSPSVVEGSGTDSWFEAEAGRRMLERSHQPWSWRLRASWRLKRGRGVRGRSCARADADDGDGCPAGVDRRAGRAAQRRHHVYLSCADDGPGSTAVRRRRAGSGGRRSARPRRSFSTSTRCPAGCWGSGGWTPPPTAARLHGAPRRPPPGRLLEHPRELHSREDHVPGRDHHRLVRAGAVQDGDGQWRDRDRIPHARARRAVGRLRRRGGRREPRLELSQPVQLDPEADLIRPAPGSPAEQEAAAAPRPVLRAGDERPRSSKE